MRTIKFRGKRIEDDTWVIGSLIFRGDSLNPLMNIDESRGPIDVVIDPATVGQFTGVFDCNGREIYEGDVVIMVTNDKWSPWPSNVLIPSRCQVIFDPELGGYVMETIIEKGDPDLHGEYTHFGDIKIDSVEVIGNIHDNPDLLKGGAQ